MDVQRVALDNGLANFYCWSLPSVYGVFPGCAASSTGCDSQPIPLQRTFIYVTDIHHDGTLDDLCELYGTPYPLATGGYYTPYVSNNMLLGMGLQCTSPTAVEPGTWGHVKALFR